MEFKHVLSTAFFSDTTFLSRLFALADQLEKGDIANHVNDALVGKVLACVFYEPSTRTRFSFEAAMHKLGGKVITTESASHFSSVTKGETLGDTIRTIAGYADAIVLRHPVVGSAREAADVSPVPIINAGDGNGEHPTQALLDMYTIQKEKKEVNGLKIALVGDLLNGRTIHSLLQLLSLYNVELYLVAPEQMQLPEKYKQILQDKNISFKEVEKLDGILNELDVLYITRVQKERFNSQEEYEKMKDYYVVDKTSLDQLKSDAIIMHPLPRVNEISKDIDDDPRSAYFRQAKNGLYVRMALLKLLFEHNG